MRDIYGKDDDIFIKNKTTGADIKPPEDRVITSDRETLGIDEKNFTPLRASRRIIGYVKEQDR